MFRMQDSLKKIFLAPLVTASLALSGCTQTVYMYPIDGPMSEVQPLPEIVATAQGVEGNTGRFSFTRPDGFTCAGRWSSAAPQASGMVTTSLVSQYGTAAGFSTFLGPRPGVNRGEAFGTCSNSSTFEVEFFTGSGTANGYGVAKDSEGNVFRLIF